VFFLKFVLRATSLSVFDTVKYHPRKIKLIIYLLYVLNQRSGGRSSLFVWEARAKAKADPDLQITGRPGHPHPEILGGPASKKKIFSPSGLSLVLK